jgi:hypothetical protein
MEIAKNLDNQDSKLSNLSYVFAICLCSSPFLLIGYMGWTAFSMLQETQAIAAAPFSNATAIITSKDPNQHLSIKSSALPKGGDVIYVDQYVYGATSVADPVCVHYKHLPNDLQFGTELVGKGACPK